MDFLTSRLGSDPYFSTCPSTPVEFFSFFFFLPLESRAAGGMLRVFICSHMGLCTCCELAESYIAMGTKAWDVKFLKQQ